MRGSILPEITRKCRSLRFLIAWILLSVFLTGCKDDKPSEKDIVKKPEQLEDRISRNLHEMVSYAVENVGKINDTISVFHTPLIGSLYEKYGYSAFWSDKGDLIPVADSLIEFIRHSRRYGLFPADYQWDPIQLLHQRLRTDSMARKDAALLSRTDLLLSDALLKISYDLKRGRLPYDSITVRKDTPVVDSRFLAAVFDEVIRTKTLTENMHALEPGIRGYAELRRAVGQFADTTKFLKFTYLPFPFKDSATFYSRVQERFVEEHMIDSLSGTSADSVALRNAIKKYQKQHNLKPTGLINAATAYKLNDTDWERFKRIAITLDKYKLMPDSMPKTYVWVNIPSFLLTLVDNDTVALESRVIVGASKTQTPELKSEISNFITYPQWTVPYSIIFGEMLPQIQKDTNYLKKQNLMVVDKNDSVIAPSTINWSKLNRNRFPYLIRQRQGDDNSLGVLKFNFRNPYSVYLHDTNARWMFSKKDRALSHGCVRVQKWNELATFLVRNDTIKYPVDTLRSWISRQEKHVVSGFDKVPVYLRYFTIEGRDGELKIYDDIYGRDRILADRLFSKYSF